jgi:hypothetical protein
MLFDIDQIPAQCLNQMPEPMLCKHNMELTDTGKASSPQA